MEDMGTDDQRSGRASFITKHPAGKLLPTAIIRRAPDPLYAPEIWTDAHRHFSCAKLQAKGGQAVPFSAMSMAHKLGIADTPPKMPKSRAIAKKVRQLTPRVKWQ